MEVGKLQDCPIGKTNFQIWIENGVCEQKSCSENFCKHHASQHKEKEREKLKK